MLLFILKSSSKDLKVAAVTWGPSSNFYFKAKLMLQMEEGCKISVLIGKRNKTK